MISEDIERIRSVEETVQRKISEAEIKSKEKVENAKREILQEIEEKRRKLIEEIERWKKGAETQGKIEAEKIINDYKEKADRIRRTDEKRINEVARAVLLKLIG